MFDKSGNVLCRDCRGKMHIAEHKDRLIFKCMKCQATRQFNIKNPASQYSLFSVR